MKHLLFLLCLVIGISSTAQISRGGEPRNWSVKDLDRFEIDFINFEALDTELIQAQDAISDQHKDTPYRFGIERDVDYSPENSGNWEELENGTKIWRIGFNCPDATSISFHLNQFELSKGAELYVWNEDRTAFLGSFNHLNNKSHGELPISFINTEKAVIEYIIPDGVDTGKLNISMVVHGYRGLINKFETDRGPYGNSGACNINVNCPEGELWQTEKKSVALILQGGNAVCTGALVNNTANDGTPYFLTANHCLGNPTNWTYLFDHESDDCNGSSGPTANTIASGDLRASNAGSDFALVELSEAPPESYDVQYCGWDKSDIENLTSSVGIHHPSGDVMKICFEEDSPYHANQGGAAVWYIDEWEDGVTEPGSSGSPLFDQNHRIIGQLYGGTAACSGNVNNGQPDWYGRFGVSWDGSSASNRLKDWLDPQGLDPQVWDGWPEGAVTYEFDAGIIMETEVEGSLCGTNFFPGVSIVNGGQQNLSSATIVVTMNGVVTQMVDWTGDLDNFESEFIALDFQPTVDGINLLEVTVTNANNGDLNDLNDTATLQFIGVPNPIWYEVNVTLDQYGSETRWDVKNQNDLIVAEGGPYNDDEEGTTYTQQFCLSEGCYDITMYDSFGDGMCCQYGDGNYSVDNQNNVEVVSSNGEFGDSETQEFCASSTNVVETEIQGLNIYPNPTKDILNVQVLSSNSVLRVYDLSGRVVYRQLFIQSGIQSINLSELSSGSYIVELTTEGRAKRESFIKE